MHNYISFQVNIPASSFMHTSGISLWHWCWVWGLSRWKHSLGYYSQISLLLANLCGRCFSDTPTMHHCHTSLCSLLSFPLSGSAGFIFTNSSQRHGFYFVKLVVLSSGQVSKGSKTTLEEETTPAREFESVPVIECLYSPTKDLNLIIREMSQASCQTKTFMVAF